jgi:hypothetical protein
METFFERVEETCDWYLLFLAGYFQAELDTTDCLEAGVDQAEGSLTANGFSTADFQYSSFLVLRQECLNFIERWQPLLETFFDEEYGPAEAGEDFCLARNDRDLAFCDKRFGKKGVLLSVDACNYGPSKVVFDEDEQRLVI